MFGPWPEHDDYRNKALLALGVLSNYDQKLPLAKSLKTESCLQSIDGFTVR